MQELPTIASLAAASDEKVRELWAGLGYYRRAGFLHRAAREVVDKHGGRLPNTAAKLLKLSGVGAYTAGAVASIAFGERTPAVDGNVVRVLARLRPALGRLEGKSLERAQHKCAKALLVPPGKPGDVNQALMELGATVCLPKRAARCGECPLRDDCGAAEQARILEVDVIDVAEQLPPQTAKKKVKVRQETVAVVVVCKKDDDGGWKLLLTQRDGGGLLGGFWESPSAVLGRKKAADGDFERILLKHASADEVKWKTATPVKHVFSHIVQSLVVKVAVVGDDKVKEGKWVQPREVGGMAVSTQMMKVLKSAGTLLGFNVSRKV